MMDFSKSTLEEIFRFLNLEGQNLEPGDETHFVIMNPDLFPGRFGGEHLEDGVFCRSFQNLVDLAELTGFQLLTPEPLENGRIQVRFRRLDLKNTWPPARTDALTYAPSTTYSRIRKTEEPWFHLGLNMALNEVAIQKNWRILELGVNDGTEIEFLLKNLPVDVEQTLAVTGIDLQEKALAQAEERLGGAPRFKWISADINHVDLEGLPPHDMLLSIDTLQSRGINGKELIVKLRKTVLRNTSAVILGFPNLRYVDGEIGFGARMKNYSEPELSLLVKDLFFFRRYFQQQGFVVRLFGKYTVFLVAKTHQP